MIRDPIAIFIIMEAMGKTNGRPEMVGGNRTSHGRNAGPVCDHRLCTVGNSLIAALYGLRSYLLPFPVAFIMGENLDAEDLRKFASACCGFCCP